MNEVLVVLGLGGLALVVGLGLGMILATRLDRLASRLGEADEPDEAATPRRRGIGGGADPGAGRSAGRDDEGKAG